MNIDRDRIHSTLLLVGCNPETLCALWLNTEDQLKKHLTNQGGGGASQEDVAQATGPGGLKDRADVQAPARNGDEYATAPVGLSPASFGREKGLQDESAEPSAGGAIRNPTRVRPTGDNADSAAAASFEERVGNLLSETVERHRSWWGTAEEVAARCLKAEDEREALNRRGVQMAELVGMKDDALAAKDAEIRDLRTTLADFEKTERKLGFDLKAKDAEIARLKSEGVEDLIRQRDEARREAAARAKTITRMGEDAETATKEYWEIRHDRDALKAALDEAKAMYVVASDDRTRLRAKLDVAEKECDRARLILGAYDSLDGGYGSRDWIQFHDARRSASRAKEK